MTCFRGMIPDDGITYLMILVAPTGFEPVSVDSESTMMDHYTTGLWIRNYRGIRNGGRCAPPRLGRVVSSSDHHGVDP